MKNSIKNAKRFFLESRKAIAITFIVFAFFALNFNSYTIWSDGYAYYAVLESLVLDHDLNLSNQVAKAGGNIYLVTQFKKGEYDKEAGRWMTPHGIGLAIMNAPLYATAVAIEAATGFKPMYREMEMLRTASVNISSNLFGILSMVLSVAILRKLKLKPSAFVILAVFVSTPLLYYSVFIPSFSHAADTFVITLFVFLFLHWRKAKENRQFLIGAILSFSIAVRYYDAFFFAVPFLYYLLSKDFKRLKWFCIGFISLIWIVPLYWQLMMGPIGTGHALGLGNDITPSILPSFLPNILLDPVHGLFLWSPITLLSLTGLYYLYKEDKKTALFLSGMFLVLVIAYGRTTIWAAGWSFSARYLTALFPIFVVGYAAFVKRHGKKAIALGAMLAAYSLFLMFNQNFAFIDGVTGTPFDMIQSWTSGKINLGLFLDFLYRFSLADNLAKIFFSF